MAFKRKINPIIKQNKTRMSLTFISSMLYLGIGFFVFKILFLYTFLASLSNYTGIFLPSISLSTPTICLLLVSPLLSGLITYYNPVFLLRSAKLLAKLPYFKNKLKTLKDFDEEMFYEKEDDDQKKMRLRSEKLEDILGGWNIN